MPTWKPRIFKPNHLINANSFFQTLLLPLPRDHVEFRCIFISSSMAFGKTTLIKFFSTIVEKNEKDTNVIPTSSFAEALKHMNTQYYQLILIDDARRFQNARRFMTKQRQEDVDNFYEIRHIYEKLCVVKKAKEMFNEDISGMDHEAAMYYAEQKGIIISGIITVIFASQGLRTLDILFKEHVDVVLLKNLPFDPAMQQRIKKELLNDDIHLFNWLQTITRMVKTARTEEERNAWKKYAVGRTMAGDLLELEFDMSEIDVILEWKTPDIKTEIRTNQQLSTEFYNDNPDLVKNILNLKSKAQDILKAKILEYYDYDDDLKQKLSTIIPFIYNLAYEDGAFGNNDNEPDKSSKKEGTDEDSERFYIGIVIEKQVQHKTFVDLAKKYDADPVTIENWYKKGVPYITGEKISKFKRIQNWVNKLKDKIDTDRGVSVIDQLLEDKDKEVSVIDQLLEDITQSGE